MSEQVDEQGAKEAEPDWLDKYFRWLRDTCPALNWEDYITLTQQAMGDEEWLAEQLRKREAW